MAWKGRELTFEQVMIIYMDQKRGGMGMHSYVLLFLAILLLISGESIKDDECQLERQEEALDLQGAAGLYQIGLRFEILGLNNEAAEAFEKAASLEPRSTSLATSLARAQSILRCQGGRKGHPLHPPDCDRKEDVLQDDDGRLGASFRIVSVAYGLCGELLDVQGRPPMPTGGASLNPSRVGWLFTRDEPAISKSVHDTEEEMDVVVQEGCEGRPPTRYWHTLHVGLHVETRTGTLNSTELLSWVEGDDPWVTARLFLRHSELTEHQELMRPIWAIVVQRQMALRNATLNQNSPPWDIPEELLKDFTMGGLVEVGKHYVDESSSDAMGNYEFGQYTLRRTEQEIEGMASKARRRDVSYYGDTDSQLYSALDAFEGLVGKDVVIVGSLVPWYEAVCIAYRANSCTTIEYNELHYEHPKIKTYTVEEFSELESPPRFDAAFSISSFEHDGLGRYGDKIDPDGDLRAMANVKSLLKEGGLLFLAVPMGKDLVYWNAHRKYGRVRLPLLFSGWTVRGAFGVDQQILDDERHQIHVQPVWVLGNEKPPKDGIDFERIIGWSNQHGHPYRGRL